MKSKKGRLCFCSPCPGLTKYWLIDCFVPDIPRILHPIPLLIDQRQLTDIHLLCPTLGFASPLLILRT